MRVLPHTIEVDDDARRAIRRHIGGSGLATRDDVRTVAVMLWDALMQDLSVDLETEEAFQDAREPLRRS